MSNSLLIKGRCVVEEVGFRLSGAMESVSDFIVRRRMTGAVAFGFAMLQLDMDIPDAVIKSPLLVELQNLANDLVVMDNVRAPRCGIGADI